MIGSSNNESENQSVKPGGATSSSTSPPPLLSQDIFNYLLALLEILPNLKWIEDPLSSSLPSKTKLPTAEIFTFLFNTGMTELAQIFPVYRARVLASQYKLMGDIVKSLSASNAFKLNNIDIVKTITTNSLVVNLDTNKTCKVLVPILIGKEF